MDWSHQLLSEPEQALFRRLAAFAGRWSLHAADALGTGPPIGAGQAIRLLAALVDKSLVQAEDTATGTRYRLLEAIKTFACEQLVASGELDDIRARHGSYSAADVAMVNQHAGVPFTEVLEAIEMRHGRPTADPCT